MLQLSRAGDEGNLQHCSRKHTNDLKKKYFRDFFLFEKLSLSTEFAHWSVFPTFLGCTQWDGLCDHQSRPLLWDNSCPVAMKHFSEMPCKRDEYPSPTAEIFFFFFVAHLLLISFLILLVISGVVM